MPQAEIHEVLNADKDKLFQVIARYEDYPDFVEGCRKAEVERSAPGKARVRYSVSMIKDVSYTVDHEEDSANGRMTWSLVESDTFKKNSGYWELKTLSPGKTDIRYVVDIEFKIPVPGFILKGLIKTNLPALIRSFERQAAKL